eukprot:485535-Pleurochrysis_carterae.AAC.1
MQAKADVNTDAYRESIRTDSETAGQRDRTDGKDKQADTQHCTSTRRFTNTPAISTHSSTQRDAGTHTARRTHAHSRCTPFLSQAQL